MTALGAVLIIAVVTGCSSSAGTASKLAGSCSWPTGSTAGYALAIGHESGIETKAHPVQHDRLLAFDVTTGSVVGDCAVDPYLSTQAAHLDGQGEYSPSNFPTVAPPVPAVGARLVPDNTYLESTVHGAVRDLANGKVTSLGFTGWQVVATSATRLLLTRDTGENNRYDTAPTSWCVLPSVHDPRSRCSPVPGAAAPGTGGIAPDGTIHWTPSAGVIVTVHGARFVLGRATDGTTTAGNVGLKDPLQVPTGLDQHSVVVLPGTAGPGPTDALRWVSLPATTSSPPVLHVASQSGDAVDQASDPPFSASMLDGGADLVTITQGGKAVEYTPGQPVRRLVSLRLPRGVLEIYTFSWPTTVGAANA